jgi:hypothetical protein
LPLAASCARRIATAASDNGEYITRYGDDMPEIKDWTWGEATAAARGATSTAADNV